MDALVRMHRQCISQRSNAGNVMVEIIKVGSPPNGYVSDTASPELVGRSVDVADP